MTNPKQRPKSPPLRRWTTPLPTHRRAPWQPFRAGSRCLCVSKVLSHIRLHGDVWCDCQDDMNCFWTNHSNDRASFMFFFLLNSTVHLLIMFVCFFVFVVTVLLYFMCVSVCVCVCVCVCVFWSSSHVKGCSCGSLWCPQHWRPHTGHWTHRYSHAHSLLSNHTVNHWPSWYIVYYSTRDAEITCLAVTRA